MTSTVTIHAGPNSSYSRLKAPSFDGDADPGSNGALLACNERLDVLQNVEDHLVEQRRSELLECGESLTLLCCGESGAGKTSLLTSLFAQKLTYANAGGPTLSLVESKTVLKFAHTNVKIRLTSVDTPGYGDTLNLSDSFERVTEYITASFRRSIDAEKRPSRKKDFSEEAGVDAVLYFISPHRLKEVDLVFMRRLAPLASIVPIIAKADTYTREELRAFRNVVSKRLHDEGIVTIAPPFAVVCSDTRNIHNSEDGSSPGRTYPWGKAYSENEDISDLPALRRFLVTDGLMKLHKRRKTHYEAYRQNIAIYRSELVETYSTKLVKYVRAGAGLGVKASALFLAIMLVGGRGNRVHAAEMADNDNRDENKSEEESGGGGLINKVLRVFWK